MKITIVVDANPIVSALIGGISRNIIFDHRFNFITTNFTLQEVNRYIPIISKKSDVDMEKISLAFSLLPVTTYPKSFYQKSIQEAEKLIGDIDKKDVDILALAISTKSPIWSEDKDFESIKGITLLKTKDLL